MALRHDQLTRQLSNGSSCICDRPSSRMISRLSVAMLCRNYVYTHVTCILPPPASESSSQECQQAKASQRMAVCEQECVCKGKWRKGKSAGKCSVKRAGLEEMKKKKKLKCAGNEAEAAVELSPPPRLAVAVWGFHCEAEKCRWWQPSEKCVSHARLGAAAHKGTSKAACCHR